MTDPITQQSRGFGFVQYLSADSAMAAISALNGKRIGKKDL
jgi:RNA recognition motif-containing protein